MEGVKACIDPRGKLLLFEMDKTIETVHKGQLPNRILMGHHRPLFNLFLTFSNSSTIKYENNPYSMRCWDSNSQPFDHQSYPITTRPGLTPPLLDSGTDSSLRLLLLQSYMIKIHAEKQSPVWPNVRIKNCPIFPKSCPKCRHSSLTYKVHFTKKPKTLPNIWKEKLSPCNYKNSPIWSHRHRLTHLHCSRNTNSSSTNTPISKSREKTQTGRAETQFYPSVPIELSETQHEWRERTNKI